MTITETIGIYGGNFDPIHIGHLRVAIEAQEKLKLSRIIWVPTGRPSHREPSIASPTQRLEMLRLALDPHPSFEIDDTDLQSPLPTYTVKTLQRLRSQYQKNVSFVLLLGMDAFLGLLDWFHWSELFEWAHIAVLSRPNYSLENASNTLTQLWKERQAQWEIVHQQPAGAIIELSVSPLSISSSDIREKYRHHLSTTYLVPSCVETYLSRHLIYQTGVV